MKNVSCVLLLISILLFLVAVYNKFAGQDGWLLGYSAQAWWRCSMAFAVWAIASKLVCPFSKSCE
jgi:hypothetical protein